MQNGNPFNIVVINKMGACMSWFQFSQIWDIRVKAAYLIEAVEFREDFERGELVALTELFHLIP